MGTSKQASAKKSGAGSRSLFPGTVVARSAAVVTAVLIALIAILDRVSDFSKRFETYLGIDLDHPAWLKGAILAGLLGSALAYAFWEAVQTRRKVLIEKLSQKRPRIKEGYFRIRPFDENESQTYERADGVHLRVLEWIQSATSNPLYLIGESGTGKTSLLNAYVLPKLRDANWEIISARSYSNPEEAIRHSVLAIVQPSKRSDPPSIDGTRKLLEKLAKRTKKPILIILDQFEEFVILHEPAAHRSFVDLLVNLTVQPITRLQVLMILRSEYQAHVEELGLPPLLQGKNLMSIGAFAPSAARKFLTESNLGLSGEQELQLIGSASDFDGTPHLVRPITLNVLGFVLARQATGSWTNLDAGSLIRGYIEAVAFQPAIREITPLLLGHLVTEGGTKLPRTLDELCEGTKLPASEVRAGLNGLAEGGLTRALDGEQRTWELSHDFIARAVHRVVVRWRPGRLRHLSAYVGPAALALTLSLVAATAWQSADMASMKAAVVYKEFLDAGIPVVPIANTGKIMIINSRPDRWKGGTDRQLIDLLIRGLSVFGRDLYGLDLRGMPDLDFGTFPLLEGLEVLSIGASRENPTVSTRQCIDGNLSVPANRPKIWLKMANLPSVHTLKIRCALVNEFIPNRKLRSLYLGEVELRGKVYLPESLVILAASTDNLRQLAAVDHLLSLKAILVTPATKDFRGLPQELGEVANLVKDINKQKGRTEPVLGCYVDYIIDKGQAQSFECDFDWVSFECDFDWVLKRLQLREYVPF